MHALFVEHTMVATTFSLYAPPSGAPNSCFVYLQRVCHSVAYSAVALPRELAGQSRLDALVAAGPVGLGISLRDHQLSALRTESARLEAQFADFLVPDQV